MVNANQTRNSGYIRECSLTETRVYAYQTPVIIQSEIFLAKVGEGRTIRAYSREQIVFSKHRVYVANAARRQAPVI